MRYSRGGTAGRTLFLLFLLLAGLGAACGDTQPAADLILHNGRLWTGVDEPRWAEGVAFREGRISAVGSSEAVLASRGAATRVIDLGGAFGLAGFNDNHVHFASAARFLEFNIMAVRTQAEFEERLRTAVDELPPGEWILGGFWGAYDAWARGSAGPTSLQPFTPDVAAVEAMTSEHPLFLQKFDNSQFAANRAALKAAGIDPERPSGDGVEFATDRQGRANGILTGDGVQQLFASVRPREFSRQRRLKQSRRALAEIRRYGVTSLSDMSDDEQLEIYRDLHQAGELTVRVHFRPLLQDFQKWAQQGVRVGSGDEWIRLGAVKGHIDGIMGNSTARFFQPYDHQPGNRGRWRVLMLDEQGEVEEGRFLGYMKEADGAGLQLSVHAIGDEANHLLLNYLEELERVNGPRDRRFRLVHAQVVGESDLPRFGKLRVIAEVQPFHASDDMRWMEQRIGRQRCRGAYAFRSLIDNGAMLTFGSDWPGTSAAEYPINPMLALYAAVTRQTVEGEPTGGWFPEQKISLEEALRAYTINTAYGNYEEDIKGTIEAGKLGDVVVLSGNLFELTPREWLDVRPRYTVVGGRVVFEP